MRESREATTNEEWDTLKRRAPKLFKALTSLSLPKSFLNLTIKVPFFRKHFKELFYLIYGFPSILPYLGYYLEHKVKVDDCSEILSREAKE